MRRGSGLALQFVEQRDRDYDTTARGLISQLKERGAQQGLLVVSIDVYNRLLGILLHVVGRARPDGAGV